MPNAWEENLGVRTENENMYFNAVERKKSTKELIKQVKWERHRLTSPLGSMSVGL